MESRGSTTRWRYLEMEVTGMYTSQKVMVSLIGINCLPFQWLDKEFSTVKRFVLLIWTVLFKMEFQDM